jgi:hypothetical protein
VRIADLERKTAFARVMLAFARNGKRAPSSAPQLDQDTDAILDNILGLASPEIRRLFS